ncbi:MAG: hypothetical protein ACLFVC_05655 [Opitutales bacterium]
MPTTTQHSGETIGVPLNRLGAALKKLARERGESPPQTFNLKQVLDKNGRVVYLITDSRHPLDRTMRSAKIADRKRSKSTSSDIEEVLTDSGAWEKRRKLFQSEVADALPPSEVAQDYLGASRQTVNNYRMTNKLFGIKRGRQFVYPRWQFGEDGQPVEGLETVLKILAALDPTPKELLSLLIRKRPFMGGQSIRDLLMDNRIEDAEMCARQEVGL